jgi:hypothetical protein
MGNVGLGYDSLESVAEIVKVVGKFTNASEKFNKTGDMILTSTILSDSMVETIHGTLESVGTALNIMMGVTVMLIIVSLVFIFYFIYEPETSATISNINNIVTLSLSMGIILSLIMIKVSFSGFNMILFDSMHGLIPTLKKGNI